MTLKLFVWDDVFCDYTCGMAFAIAETKEEAIELIVKNEKYINPKNELTVTEPTIYEITPELRVCRRISGGG